MVRSAAWLRRCASLGLVQACACAPRRRGITAGRARPNPTLAPCTASHRARRVHTPQPHRDGRLPDPTPVADGADTARRGAAGVRAVQVLRRRPGGNSRRAERHRRAGRRDPPAAGAERAGCVQLWIFVKQIVTFDWGKSWATNESVANLFATRLPATLTVMMPILILDVLLALPIAMWVAYRRGSLTDRTIMVRDDGRAVDQLPGLRHRRPVRVRLPARLVSGAGLERQRAGPTWSPTCRCRCCWR